MILAKGDQALVFRYILERRVEEQLLILELKLRRSIDDALPFEVQRRVEKRVILHKVLDHLVEVRRIHPLIKLAVLVPGGDAGQRLLEDRRVLVSAEPHRGHGLFRFRAAGGGDSHSGHMLNAVHSPVGCIEGVERVRNDTQPAGVRGAGDGFEIIGLPIFIECDDVGFALQSGNRLWCIRRGIDVSGKPHLRGIRSGQRIGLPRSSTTQDAVEVIPGADDLA